MPKLHDRSTGKRSSSGRGNNISDAKVAQGTRDVCTRAAKIEC